MTVIPRVHFSAQLETPALDRPRRTGLIYPKAVQSKIISGRKSSFDLFWRWSRLSSASAISNLSPTLEEPTTPPGSVSNTSSSASSMIFSAPSKSMISIESADYDKQGRRYSVMEVTSQKWSARNFTTKLLGALTLEIPIPSRSSSTSSSSAYTDCTSSYPSSLNERSSSEQEEGSD